jgi:hypothetical protein
VEDADAPTDIYVGVAASMPMLMPRSRSRSCNNDNNNNNISSNKNNISSNNNNNISSNKNNISSNNNNIISSNNNNISSNNSNIRSNNNIISRSSNISYNNIRSARTRSKTIAGELVPEAAGDLTGLRSRYAKSSAGRVMLEYENFGGRNVLTSCPRELKEWGPSGQDGFLGNVEEISLADPPCDCATGGSSRLLAAASDTELTPERKMAPGTKERRPSVLRMDFKVLSAETSADEIDDIESFDIEVAEERPSGEVSNRLEMRRVEMRFSSEQQSEPSNGLSSNESSRSPSPDSQQKV